MNAIVTVIGQDRVGIIAAVCGKLAELNVNILDITQTILKGRPMWASTSWLPVWKRWGSRCIWLSASSGKRSLTPCTGSEGESHAEPERNSLHH